MGTQRTGLAGERPMEGLLEKEKLDAVYADALPEVEAQRGPAKVVQQLRLRRHLEVPADSVEGRELEPTAKRICRLL